MGWAVGTELNVKKPKTENKKGLEGTHCKANGPPSLSKIASYVYNSGARSRFVPRPNSEMRGFYSLLQKCIISFGTIHFDHIIN